MSQPDTLHPQPGLPISVKLRDGRSVLVRHIRPDDASRLVDLFWHLSSETRWRRFFVPLDHVDPNLVWKTAQRLAAIDRARELALVAVIKQQGQEEIIAVARFASDRTGAPEAECSIVVRDDYHGLGLGTHLFNLLLQAARQRHLRQLVLLTQCDNLATLALVRHTNVPHTMQVSSGYYEIHFHLTNET